MARPDKKLVVSNTPIASASATIGASGNVSQKLTQGFPTGDALLHNLKLRNSGNLNLTATAPGAIVANGGLINLRSLWLSTPQHGIIVNGLDGLALHNLDYIRNGVKAYAQDVDDSDTGTPSFDYHIPLDFRDKNAARPEDTTLDLFRISYMELMVNYGGAADHISGGSYSTETIQNLVLEMHATVDPGPIGPGDVPTVKPYMDIIRMPINQTQTAFQITLPYGGRLIARYMIQQRNGSTLQPLNNTVIGVNDTDRVSFLVGGYAWYNRIEWLALQAENLSDLKLTQGVPTGMGVLNWAQLYASGYRLSEMLGLNSQNGATPQVEINADVTAVSNGQLWIVTDARMPIPSDAQRPKAATPGA